jgi:ribosomal protein S6--L-glutamate ligase
MKHSEKVIALEARLRECENVITLGVRPNFSDYSVKEAALIRNADKIYYPSSYYADMLDAMGKKMFPSIHTYRFVQDKIKQSTLFQLAKIPHPETRWFYGKKKIEKVLSYFDYPFVGKIPRGSALGRGVYLIDSRAELETYCSMTKIAYIQQYLPIERDLRVVVIGDRVVCAYWRITSAGEFRSNVNCGAEISFDRVPAPAVDLALHTAKHCGWNDVGIDICEYQGNYYVLEANMKYGRQGFAKAGIDYATLMEKMIDNEEI